MDHINKPVLNSPIGPLPFYRLLTNLLFFFVVPSPLSVIRLITETHLVFMSVNHLIIVFVSRISVVMDI